MDNIRSIWRLLLGLSVGFAGFLVTSIVPVAIAPLSILMTIVAVYSSIAISSRRFDRRVQGLEYYVIILGVRPAFAAFLTSGAMLLLGLMGGINDKFWVVGVFFMLPMAFFVCLPVGICYVLLLPPTRQDDSYVRCRQCDYRVDNIPGPYCPECGTQIFAAEDDHEFRIGQPPGTTSAGE